MQIVAVLFLLPLLTVPALAQQDAQVLPTDEGTLNVRLFTVPSEIASGDDVKLKIDFINPSTEKIQAHIDFRVVVLKDESLVFGPMPLTHTSTGSVTIPAISSASEGVYNAIVEVEGILFQPIPLETALFTIAVGQDDPPSSPPSPELEDPARPSPDVPQDELLPPPPPENGGCLIATAAYGSELAIPVQQLRETRDNVVLQTESGSAFMSAFNHIYYSFSPAIADLERTNPTFREAVKIAITPLLSTLSILNHAEIDSEAEMMTLGLAVIALNLGIYAAPPSLLVLALYRFTRGRKPSYPDSTLTILRAK